VPGCHDILSNSGVSTFSGHGSPFPSFGYYTKFVTPVDYTSLTRPIQALSSNRWLDTMARLALQRKRS
jgi:hypothetical protein